MIRKSPKQSDPLEGQVTLAFYFKKDWPEMVTPSPLTERTDD